MTSTDNDKIDQIIKYITQACLVLESLKTKEVREVTVQPPKPTHKFKKLIAKEAWPKAVSDGNIVNRDSDRERNRRANMILDHILERDIAGKKFLDLACGMGDLSYAALALNPELSVGYDTKRGGWGRFPSDQSLILSTDLRVVRSYAPFDAIFLYDSLQKYYNPVATLETAASLLADNGLLYIRVRPWSSRCGMDDVIELNKAFAHLFLEDHELTSLGLQTTPIKVIHHETYEEWFQMAGLNIRRAIMTKQSVEDIFKTPLLKKTIMDLYGAEEFPEESLRVNYIDYTLEIAQ